MSAEELQLGDLLHKDATSIIFLRSDLRDDQTTAHNAGREDMLFECEICLKLVNISI